MARRLPLLALVAFASTVHAAAALAQETDSLDNIMPSLTERLEQFRQDLLGNPGQAKQQAEAERETAQQKKTPGLKRDVAPAASRAAAVEPDPAPPKPAAPKPPKVAAKTMPQVTTPPRMEVQSARKAKSGRGLIPTETPPEVAANSGPAKSAASGPSRRRPPLPKSVETPADSPANAPSASAAKSIATDEESFDETKSSNSPEEPRVARTEPRELPRALDEPSSSGARSGGSGVLFSTQSPVLSVEATGPRRVLIGKECQFSVRLRNAGAAANNVVVSVNIPEGVEVASAHASTGTVPTPQPGQARGPLEWKIARLEADSAETMHLTLVPRKSAPLDLAIHYTFTPQASQTLVEVQEPKLEMAINGPAEVNFGETRIFKMSISNPGNADTENVVIGLMPVGRSGEGVTSHKLGTLHAGESKTIDVELTAREAGELSIKAQAYADGGLRTEAAAQVMVRRAKLDIDVEAPRIKYAGTVGTYRVSVINSGTALAENVQLGVLLPAEAKYVASNASGRFDAQQGRVAWTAGNLEPGAKRTFDLQCSLGAPGDNRMQVVATAADNLTASTTSNTQVEALADLKIEVRDPQGPVAVGQEAEFEIVVRNRGTKAAEGVDLTVFFSEGLEATRVEGGAHEIGSGQVVFKPIAEVPAGEATTFKVRARADREGNHVFRAEVVCTSLNTRLAAEEATHFYGDTPVASTAAEPEQPQPRAVNPLEPAPQEPAPAGEPTPAEEPAPAQEPTPADDPPPAEEPTPAESP